MEKLSLCPKAYILLLMSVLILSCSAQDEQARIDLSKASGLYDSVYGSVHCGLQDKAGNMWFGTTGAGVLQYNGKKFTQYTTEDGLPNNHVGCILQDKNGLIWLGTDSGPCTYDGKIFTPVPIPGGYKGSIMFLNNLGMPPAAGSRSSGEAIFSMMQDSKGNIWLGTSAHGVYCYDGKTLHNYLYSDTVIYANGGHENAISKMFEDKAGNIWFSSWSRMSVYRYDGRSFTNISVGQGLCDDMISSITQDNKGNIWYGCRDHGACVYDGNTFTNYTAKDGLGNNTIVSMLKDSKANIWMGSDGKHGGDGAGVCCFNGKTFINYTTKNGLSDNRVFAIVEDRAGNIWLGTRGMGLCMYNGSKFTNFSQQKSLK